MNYNEERIKIEGKVSIGATITRNDKEKSPAIVIVMGTGKLDRDGNGSGLNLNMYKDLANVFAELGFVVARFDKRGTHESSGDFNSCGLSDLVEDAVSVVQYVKSLPYVDENRVIVCGHSEGTMITTLLSQKEDVAGLILLGGAGTCLKDALHHQYVLLDEQSKQKKGLVGLILRKTATLEKSEVKGKKMFDKANSTDSDTMRISGMKMSAKWLREHDSYTSEDFVSILKSFGKPILAVTGTADLNVDFRDLDALKDIPSVQCYAPEGVNHILREVDDDNLIFDIKKQYKRLCTKPFHEGTINTIKEWLQTFEDIE